MGLIMSRDDFDRPMRDPRVQAEYDAYRREHGLEDDQIGDEDFEDFLRAQYERTAVVPRLQPLDDDIVF